MNTPTNSTKNTKPKVAVDTNDIYDVISAIKPAGSTSSGIWKALNQKISECTDQEAHLIRKAQNLHGDIAAYYDEKNRTGSAHPTGSLKNYEDMIGAARGVLSHPALSKTLLTAALMLKKQNTNPREEGYKAKATREMFEFYHVVLCTFSAAQRAQSLSEPVKIERNIEHIEYSERRDVGRFLANSAKAFQPISNFDSRALFSYSKEFLKSNPSLNLNLLYLLGAGEVFRGEISKTKSDTEFSDQHLDAFLDQLNFLSDVYLASSLKSRGEISGRFGRGRIHQHLPKFFHQLGANQINKLAGSYIHLINSLTGYTTGGTDARAKMRNKEIFYFLIETFQLTVWRNRVMSEVNQSEKNTLIDQNEQSFLNLIEAIAKEVDAPSRTDVLAQMLMMVEHEYSNPHSSVNISPKTRHALLGMFLDAHNDHPTPLVKQVVNKIAGHSPIYKAAITQLLPNSSMELAKALRDHKKDKIKTLVANMTPNEVHEGLEIYVKKQTMAYPELQAKLDAYQIQNAVDQDQNKPDGAQRARVRKI